MKGFTVFKDGIFFCCLNPQQVCIRHLLTPCLDASRLILPLSSPLSIFLFISAVAPTVKIIPPQGILREGDSLSLTCSVTGNPLWVHTNVFVSLSLSFRFVRGWFWWMWKLVWSSVSTCALKTNHLNWSCKSGFRLLTIQSDYDGSQSGWIITAGKNQHLDVTPFLFPARSNYLSLSPAASSH